jgi:trimeric autotransporter adhesin
MYRNLTHAALSIAFATFAFAQTPQSAPVDPAPAVSRRITVSSENTQTFRGILMDAGCQAIQNRTTSSNSLTSSISDEATRSRTIPASTPPATTSGTEKSATTAHATGVGGAASATASGAGASGSLNNTTNTGGTAGNTPTTASTTGVAKDQAGEATATSKTTPPADERTTGNVSGPTASGSSSVTTYSGAGTASTTAGREERSRSMDATGAGDQWITAREKYKDCKVTSNSSSFALMSNGQLYMIDDPQGILRQQARSNTGGDWQTVTVIGDMQGDRISASSLR